MLQALRTCPDHTCLDGRVALETGRPAPSYDDAVEVAWEVSPFERDLLYVTAEQKQMFGANRD